MCETYNGGWPNKPTWAVFSGLTSDNDTELRAREMVQRTGVAAPICLRRWIEQEYTIKVESTLSIYYVLEDLLTWALDTVDWEYLAKKLREE